MSVINHYQTIPELGFKGRMNTPEEFDKIGLPKDLTGKSVLDVGCNAGAFLLECAERGALNLYGVEPSTEWRVIAHGVLVESGYIARSIVHERFQEYSGKGFDLILLLSVTHVSEEESGQGLVDKCYELLSEDGLMIVEINDRLQKEDIKLPGKAEYYGSNKDSRSVHHVTKV